MASLKLRTDTKTPTWRLRWRHNGEVQILTFHSQPEGETALKLVEGLGDQVTKQDAWRLLNGVTDEPNHSPTLDQWADRYFAAHTGTQDDTLERYGRQYEIQVRNTIVGGSRLGGMHLDQIEKETVGLWVRHLQKHGYAPNTVRRYHTMLSALLSAAIPSHLTHNPAKGVKLPKVQKVKIRDDKVFLSEQEAQLLAECFEEGLPRDLFMFMLNTGMRWSEVTALLVSDVDSPDDPRVVHVNRAWKKPTKNRGWHLGTPKSEQSEARPVTLTEEGRAAIRPWCAGKAPKQLVFSWDGDFRLDVDRFRGDHWDPAVERAQRKGLKQSPTPKATRDTHAGWLISRGVPLTAVQRRLGHESIKVTSDTYGHLERWVDRDLLAGLSRSMPKLP